MEDFQQKRRLIEQGQLTSWKRRGRGAFTVEHVPFHRTLLQTMFRSGWLRLLGERNARNAVVRTLRFTFDSLPSAFCGFTLLHLSDIHADGLTGLSESLSRRLQDLQVDVCVLTGDYRYKLHGPSHDVYPHMEKILASINARYGIVGVLGNHDSLEKVPVLERLGVGFVEVGTILVAPWAGNQVSPRMKRLIDVHEREERDRHIRVPRRQT